MIAMQVRIQKYNCPRLTMFKNHFMSKMYNLNESLDQDSFVYKTHFTFSRLNFYTCSRFTIFKDSIDQDLIFTQLTKTEDSIFTHWSVTEDRRLQ